MRWQTIDPLGFEDGLNLYAYVHNNPFYYKDFDGQTACCIVIPVLEFTFGLTLGPIILPTVAVIATAAVVYGGYKLAMQASNQIDGAGLPEAVETDLDGQPKSKSKDGKDKPPYCGEKLGGDSTKCPGEGFEWRGRGGPETGKGSWIKDHKLPTEESLHPDLAHPPPKAPHWDYEGPGYPEGAELYLDGTWKLK